MLIIHNYIDTPKPLIKTGTMLNGSIERWADDYNNIYIFVAGSMYKRVPKHCSGEWMSDKLCDGVIYRKLISTEYGPEYYKRIKDYK